MQSEATVAAVRKRDLGCRVSRTPAGPTAQGQNFTGLEVAHIFPLGEADKVRPQPAFDLDLLIPA
jgi:hypothetical protein